MCCLGFRGSEQKRWRSDMAAPTGAKKITEAGIARIKAPEKGRLQIADAVLTGLWLRVTHTGSRSWSSCIACPAARARSG